MRLRRFEAINFKALQSVSVDWDDFLVLIGANNSGKSCILSALSWFLSGSAIKDPKLFHKFETGAEAAIELIGHFDQLSDSDKEQVAVKGRMNNGEWILKKRYWLEGEENSKGTWKEELFSFSSREVFVGWPDPDTSWSNFPENYGELIQQIPNRPGRPNAESREILKQLVRQHRPDLIQQGSPEWIANPGGGGNWKSNANSIIPKCIYVRAVHDASDETDPKDPSTYGKLINLVIERQLSQRSEMGRLKDALAEVMELFCPDDQHPEHQASEIRRLEEQITAGLNEVIAGQARIKTQPIQVAEMLLPSTSLVIRDPLLRLETEVVHQGHGLQRTLIMTMLQLLAGVQDAVSARRQDQRATILIVEEPELYMHPQMERKMRDVLYRLASQQGVQVICCTHSPVFLDISEKYKSIVRLEKAADGRVLVRQVLVDIFSESSSAGERERLQTVARFNPSVNELFFSKQVVLFEEFSAIAAFERAAQLTGLFDRHPTLRREIAAVDCSGKQNIPAFQKVLNAFAIPYRVVHDEDRSNPGSTSVTVRIAAAAAADTPPAPVHFLSPENLESLLGGISGKKSTYAAVKKVEELHAGPGLPTPVTQAMNFIYFGSVTEPLTSAAAVAGH